MECFGVYILIMVLSLAYGHRIGKRGTIHTIIRDGYIYDGGEEYLVIRQYRNDEKVNGINIVKIDDRKRPI